MSVRNLIIFAAIIIQGVSLCGRSKRLLAETAAVTQSVVPVVPTPSQVASVVESFDTPESYFIRFDAVKAFATPTLTRVKDVERLQKTMLGQIDDAMEKMLKKNDPAGDGEKYLDKNQKSIEAQADSAKAQAEYKAKRDAYCAKEKKPEFKALEVAAGTDSSQRNAFMTLLKRAGLRDEWDDVHEKSKQALEASKARNAAWAALSVGLQNAIRVYQRKRDEVATVAAKKIAQLETSKT